MVLLYDSKYKKGKLILHNLFKGLRDDRSWYFSLDRGFGQNYNGCYISMAKLWRKSK